MKAISENRLLIFCELLLFIGILQNMLCWFTLGLSRGIVTLFGVLCLLRFQHFGNYRKLTSESLILLLLLICIYDILLDGFPYISNLFPYILGVIIFHLKDEIKQTILHFSTKALSLIIGISLILYISWLFIGFSPLGVVDVPDAYDIIDNYFFFLLPSVYLIPRFSGPFIEPGHLGTVCVFFLYANNFQFKKNPYLWSLFIAILLSLSLAGYILLICAILLKLRLKITTIILCAFFTFSTYYIITEEWNKGDNPVNIMLINRLEFDESKGIVGNNRVSESTDDYWKKFSRMEDVCFGIGTNAFNALADREIIGGTGYKMYFIQYGAIKVCLLFLYYFTIAISCQNKRFALCFLLLVILSFIQRSYPQWIALLLPFICGMNKYNFVNNISPMK